MRLPVALLISLALWGCSSGPKQAAVIEPEAAVPGDFWLELIVPVESPAPRRDQAEMVRRFVVLPDATLHYRQQARSPGPGGLPFVVRTLSQQQMRELWELTQPLVWSNQATQVDRGYCGGRTLPGARLMIFAQGRVRSIMPQDADEQSRISFDAVAKRMDALAFSPGAAEAVTAAAAPHRYDFGPDPYARYRR